MAVHRFPGDAGPVSRWTRHRRPSLRLNARGWWGRNWKWFVPTGCLGMLLLVAGFVFVIITIVFGALKSSDAYKDALAKAKADPRVVSCARVADRRRHVHFGKDECERYVRTSGHDGPHLRPEGQRHPLLCRLEICGPVDLFQTHGRNSEYRATNRPHRRSSNDSSLVRPHRQTIFAGVCLLVPVRPVA